MQHPSTVAADTTPSDPVRLGNGRINQEDEGPSAAASGSGDAHNVLTVSKFLSESGRTGLAEVPAPTRRETRSHAAVRGPRSVYKGRQVDPAVDNSPTFGCRC